MKLIDTSSLERSFRMQFEPDGDQWIYRRSAKGRGVKVSAAEMEVAVSDYLRRVRRMILLIVFATFAALTVAFIFSRDGEISDIMLWLLVLPVVVVTGVGSLWIYRAAARSFKGRQQIGRDVSGAELRQRYLAQMGYGQLALTFAIGGFIIVRQVKHWPPVGSDWAWVALGSAVATLAAIQTIRKFVSGA